MDSKNITNALYPFIVTYDRAEMVKTNWECCKSNQDLCC